MGVSERCARIFCPHSSTEFAQQRMRSQKIDKQLREDQRKCQRMVKLLLLGAGESGKSTFLKQMKIIHGLEFEPEQIHEFCRTIYQNVIRGMQVIAGASIKRRMHLQNETNENHRKSLLMFQRHGDVTSENFGQSFEVLLSSLWSDPTFQELFKERSQLQLVDSVGYFLNNISRISHVDYIPSQKDILLCRKTTKGIIECPLTIENVPFLFVDVGGQRTQRQKWFQCFDNVTAILFLASSSEFDQVLLEDGQTNRLEEACTVFDSIVNNKIFAHVAVILFLNKMDLLEQKVERYEVNIEKYFPEEFQRVTEIEKYVETFGANPFHLTDVKSFILYLFLSRQRAQNRSVYHHFTTAIDTKNITFVFNSVKETILRKNLNALMLE